MVHYAHYISTRVSRLPSLSAISDYTAKKNSDRADNKLWPRPQESILEGCRSIRVAPRAGISDTQAVLIAVPLYAAGRELIIIDTYAYDSSQTFNRPVQVLRLLWTVYLSLSSPVRLPLFPSNL